MLMLVFEYCVIVVFFAKTVQGVCSQMPDHRRVVYVFGDY